MFSFYFIYHPSPWKTNCIKSLLVSLIKYCLISRYFIFGNRYSLFYPIYRIVLTFFRLLILLSPFSRLRLCSPNLLRVNPLSRYLPSSTSLFTNSLYFYKNLFLCYLASLQSHHYCLILRLTGVHSSHLSGRLFLWVLSSRKISWECYKAVLQQWKALLQR